MLGSLDRRKAFTLVEVMITLAIAAVILLSARTLLDGVAGAARVSTDAARREARTANADHLLRTLFGRLEVGTPHDTTFGGDAESMHFTSWCATPGGWLERCDVALAVERQVDGLASLVVHLKPRERGGRIGIDRVVLDTGRHALALRYLDDPRAGGLWFVQWGSGIVAPLAIAVVAGPDTSIIRIGERG